MRTLAQRLLFASFALWSFVACVTEDPVKPKEPRGPEDPWAAIARTPEWLHAARDFSGPKDEECKLVLGWVKNEDGCRGAVCVHGRDLAKEWTARCAKIVPDEVAAVATLESTFKERASQDRTPCTEEAENILSSGCSGDKTCQGTAEHWAAHCAKVTGSPLLTQMIAHTVERRIGDGTKVTLDNRDCEDLRRGLSDASKCAHPFACEDAKKTVDAYRARCEDESSVATIATGIHELAVLARAGGRTSAVAVTTVPIAKPEDAPLVFDDGMGAVLAICEKRALDVNSYVGLRFSCAVESSILVGRAHRTKEGAELHAFALPFHGGDDNSLYRDLSWLAVGGEGPARDEAGRTTFAGLLDELSQGKAQLPADEALAQLVRDYGPSLRRDAGYRKVLGDHDQALGLVFQARGQKLAAGAKGLKGADLATYAAIAQANPFADPATKTPAAFPSVKEPTQLRSLLPTSMAAFDKAFDAIAKKAKLAGGDRGSARKALARIRDRGAECATAETTARAKEAHVRACVEGDVAPAECGTIREDLTAMRDARAIVDSVFLDSESTLTGVSKAMPFGRDDIVATYDAAGCKEPTWSR